MTAKKDEAVARMNAELLAARNMAKAAFDTLREQGQSAPERDIIKGRGSRLWQ